MPQSNLVGFALAAVLVVAGCGREQLPANQSPPKDRADLEARYEALDTGIPEPEITAFMGKSGAALAGYSTQVVKRKPEGGNAMPEAGESDKSWASDDKTGAIRVVFRADGKARMIELLKITPMGPAPAPREESKGP